MPHSDVPPGIPDSVKVPISVTSSNSVSDIRKGSAAAIPQDLLDQFLHGRSPDTIAAYRCAMAAFMRWGRRHGVENLSDFLMHGQGSANATVLRYRADLIDKGRSPATINQRLTAIRSIVRFANTIGLVAWTLSIQNLRHEPYRDTAGPGEVGFRSLLAAARIQLNPAKAARDYALLWMLFTPPLRVSEALRTNLADLDSTRHSCRILGKGKREYELVTLPKETWNALLEWLDLRGRHPGPIFVSIDPRCPGHRLTRRSAHRTIRKLGLSAGLKAWPHGLRHAGITAAMDLGLPLRSVQRYSRHADVRTLMRYDDNRSDLGGDVSKLVAEHAARSRTSPAKDTATTSLPGLEDTQ